MGAHRARQPDRPFDAHPPDELASKTCRAFFAASFARTQARMNQARKVAVDPSGPAPDVRPSLASWYTPGFSDGLGDRLLMFDNTAAASLELLRFKPEFGNHPVFE